MEFRPGVPRHDLLLEREFARPVATGDRIAIRIQVAPALELARIDHPGSAREVPADTARKVAGIGLAVPVRQVRGIERIEREVRALRYKLCVAFVFRGAEAGLHAGPRTHA